jgi:hypothetical protein
MTAAGVAGRAPVARGVDRRQIGLELVEFRFQRTELLEHRRTRVPAGPRRRMQRPLKESLHQVEHLRWDGLDQMLCQGRRT